MNKNKIAPLTGYLLIVISLFLNQCDYGGNLINPNDTISPHFSIKGHISAEIPKEFFAVSKSPRIGFIPLNNFTTSEGMRNPDIQKKWFEPLDFPQSFSTEYPVVSFQGEFPFKFSSEFKELPSRELLQPYQCPSGNLYQVGIYAVTLFDDVNKDGKILISAGYSSAGNINFEKNSDSIIGIVPNHFIVYLEQPGIITELNTYISKHIGAHAQWIGLKSGFNLVKFTDETNHLESPFTGIQSVPAETNIPIEPFSMALATNENFQPPAVFEVSSKLFFFQRNYMLSDIAFPVVKINSTAEKIFIKCAFANKSVTILKNSTPGLLTDAKSVLFTLSAAGIFDMGYYNFSNPYTDMKAVGESFTINSQSCASHVDRKDTIAIDSDTIHIEFQKSGVNSYGGSLAPLYVDSLSIVAHISETAPWTVLTSD